MSDQRAPPSNCETLYDALIAAGVEVHNHESDLHMPVTDQTTAILKRFPVQAKSATTFISRLDEMPWYDVPFSYEPFYRERAARTPGGARRIHARQKSEPMNETLRILEQLTSSAEKINAIQHSGRTVPAHLWSDLYQHSQCARAHLERSNTPDNQEAHHQSGRS